MNGPPVFALQVQNFALITYAVPAGRVRRHLPQPYELDTFDAPEGHKAFVTTTCFCNHDFRPASLPFPRHTFNESTYRTYVTRDGAKGVYFFGRYLGTRLAWSAQRLAARDTYGAEFELDIEENGNGYPAYECSATSSAGDTHFVVSATEAPKPKGPFDSGEELAQFLTYRLEGYYTSSAGFQGRMPVEHPRMSPLAGSLSSARFDLWGELEILTPEEAGDPFSVLVVPEVPFRLFAPRPVGRS